MRLATQAVVVGVLFLAAVCAGYGGFEVTGSFLSLRGLNQTLDDLNREWGGQGEFTQTTPLWWVGGHGGGQVGVVTFGGSGALGARAVHADSLGSEIAAVRGNFEAGYPYVPVSWFWVRPCVEVTGAGWFVYAHTVEGGTLLGGLQPNFSKWSAAWTIGVVPGVEVMGRLPASRESYVGLFARASYFLAVAGPQQYGDLDRLDFGLNGFSVQFGVRFGKTSYRAFRI